MYDHFSKIIEILHFNSLLIWSTIYARHALHPYINYALSLLHLHCFLNDTAQSLVIFEPCRLYAVVHIHIHLAAKCSSPGSRATSDSLRDSVDDGISFKNWSSVYL